MGQGPGLGARFPLAVVRERHQVRSGVSGQLLMSTPSGRRADVGSVDLHPRVGDGVLRLQWKADHQFRRVSLVAEQARTSRAQSRDTSPSTGRISARGQRCFRVDEAPPDIAECGPPRPNA